MENTALTPLSANAAAAEAAPQTFFTRLAALPLQSKLMLGVGIAALFALIVASALWSRADDYKVLFANLSDKDAGAIVAQLSQANVPYKFAGGGSAILVPADKVHDVRLKLAQTGLPKGGTVGFELMDSTRFGTTQFQERLNFQRGLEGELVRSITSMAAVQAARVHLALPQQNSFFREQQKPSASVLLTLHGGRTLDRAQIAGIVHLVSSSVPELNPKSVSIIDQTGALLTGPEALGNGGGLDAQQLQYVNHIESSYTKRVMDILEPVVGRDNLRAQVSADIDFSQSEQTSEQFKPNQGAEPAAVRSAQTSDTGSQGNAPVAGVPGAATNQPPVPATAPVNGASAPLQGAQGGSTNGTTRREAVTNYEVDKTVRVTRGATGSIKRISAAVVVNHRSTVDKKGVTQTVPLAPEELEKLTALVQETLGYNKDRGDTVKVINAPFRTDKPVVDETPLWKQPEVIELLRSMVAPLGLALLGALLVFGVIRPVLKQARPPEVVERVEAVVDDVDKLPGLENAQASADSSELIAIGPDGKPALPAPDLDPAALLAQQHLEIARRFAKENPAAVANIMRSWISKD